MEEEDAYELPVSPPMPGPGQGGLFGAWGHSENNDAAPSQPDEPRGTVGPTSTVSSQCSVLFTEERMAQLKNTLSTYRHLRELSLDSAVHHAQQARAVEDTMRGFYARRNEPAFRSMWQQLAQKRAEHLADAQREEAVAETQLRLQYADAMRTLLVNADDVLLRTRDPVPQWHTAVVTRVRLEPPLPGVPLWYEDLSAITVAVRDTTPGSARLATEAVKAQCTYQLTADSDAAESDDDNVLDRSFEGLSVSPLHNTSLSSTTSSTSSTNSPASDILPLRLDDL